MKLATHPLLWFFNQDDGFYYAEGYYTNGFKIVPVTLAFKTGEKTTFHISAQVDEEGHQIDVGICHDLANAKQVCDLLENG